MQSFTRRVRALLVVFAAGGWRGELSVAPVLRGAAATPALAFASLVAAITAVAETRAPADAAIVPKYEKFNTARKLLSEAEVADALRTLPGWRAEAGTLRKTFVRKSFVDAISLLGAIVPECERLDHHPEIFTVYNKVNFTLTTYDAGQRISSFDVLLAQRIEAVATAPASP